MSFMFPRTIAVHRPVSVPLRTASPATVEVAGYAGVATSTETVVYTGMAANIQMKSSVRQHSNALPADTRAPYVWSIFLRRGAVPDGGVQNRDIIIDDRGERYQVEAVRDNTVFGPHIRAIKLEV